MRNFFYSEDFQGLGQIQHLRDGGRLLHVPAAKRMRKAGELPAQPQALTAAANGENLSFPFERGVFKTQIKASSPQRITQTPFFIRAQDNKRDRSCLNRS